jgi:DDE superfamily endonuclease
LRRRADALFELTDTLLSTGPTLSPAHLSLAPVHRRGWGSLYAAPVHGRLSRQAVRALVTRYPLAGGQLPAQRPRPLFLFDAGYDPVQLALELGNTPVDLLVRLRKNRCFYADPDPASAAKTGRPRRYGHKFSCADPATWLPPSAEYTTEAPEYGHVCVRAWAGLHAKPQNHATKGTRQPKPLICGALLPVAVSRLPRPTRTPQPLWLWWQGPGEPNLALLWRAYVRRFDQEHTFRFLERAS